MNMNSRQFGARDDSVSKTETNHKIGKENGSGSFSGGTRCAAIDNNSF